MKTRRNFLSTTAAGAVGLASRQIFAESKPGNYIDAHVHIWTPDFENYPLAEGYSKDNMVPPSFTADELFAECRPNGVSRIVLIQMSFYKFDNRYMLDMMAKHEGVFGGVAIVDETAAGVGKTMISLKEQGVRGFRIYAKAENAAKWAESPGMLEMWKTGADHKLAMCLLLNADALPAVQQMCQRFPETPVVIDHFARVGVSGEVKQDELDLLLKLAEFKNVHVKTSAFYALGKKAAPYTDLGPMIRQLRDAFGPQRLMWATDCPYQVQKGHTYEASIALIRDRLDFLTAEDKEWMLRKTAESVFFSA